MSSFLRIFFITAAFLASSLSTHAYILSSSNSVETFYSDEGAVTFTGEHIITFTQTGEVSSGQTLSIALWNASRVTFDADRIAELSLAPAGAIAIALKGISNDGKKIVVSILSENNQGDTLTVKNIPLKVGNATTSWENLSMITNEGRTYTFPWQVQVMSGDRPGSWGPVEAVKSSESIERFYIGAGAVTLSGTHTLTFNGRIAPKGSTITLSLSPESKFLFNPNALSSLTLTTSGSVALSASGVSIDMKKITLNVTASALKWDMIVFTNIPLLVYDRTANEEFLSVTLNSVNRQLTFPGRLRISDERRLIDTLAPIDLRDARAFYQSGMLSVYATRSPEPDVAGYTLSALDSSGTVLQQAFRLDLPWKIELRETPSQIRIQLVDQRENLSSGALIPVEILAANAMPSATFIAENSAVGASADAMSVSTTAKRVPLYSAKSVSLSERVHQMLLEQVDRKASEAYYLQSIEAKQVRALRESIASTLVKIEKSKTSSDKTRYKRVLTITVKRLVKAAQKL